MDGLQRVKVTPTLARKEVPSAEEIQARVAPVEPEWPDLLPLEVDLREYDEFVALEEVTS